MPQTQQAENTTVMVTRGLLVQLKKEEIKSGKKSCIKRGNIRKGKIAVLVTIGQPIFFSLRKVSTKSFQVTSAVESISKRGDDFVIETETSIYLLKILENHLPLI